MNTSLSKLMASLAREGKEKNIPNISMRTGSILTFFLEITKARSILEIGCANGFSTLFLAEYAKKNESRIVACDFSRPLFEAAKKNIADAGLASFVEFRFGNALHSLSSGERFDFVFIDGEKKSTLDFLVLSLAHLTEKGIILIDNASRFPEKMAPFCVFLENNASLCSLNIPTENGDSMILVHPKSTKTQAIMPES